MLNPRSFLEDCLRCGLSSFWTTGMPWHVLSSVIDVDFNYNVSDQTKATWVAATGRNWDNSEDHMVKEMKCPACRAHQEVPWTTCGRDEKSEPSASGPGLIGNGYGDGDLNWVCSSCATTIEKKLLSVAKFARDAQSLVVDDITMPGTILEPMSGKPAFAVDTPYRLCPRTFPNRLIRRSLIVQIPGLLQPGVQPPPTMDTVRNMIQKLLVDGAALREIEGVRGRLRLESRICVRKMMSRYWENFSPFALDLAGAVMRQGIFTAKMTQIDWLHSPACRETMTRLITKYKRFVTIMRENPNKTCVPTLDVDLAWHTHQLSPSAYYKFMTAQTTKFIDHDDKMDEDKLSDAFEWTTKAYQERYTEVYSECTCWYCETVRASNTGTVGRLLGVSNQEKASQSFHDSGRARLCPPEKGAHVSAHNAVRQQPSSVREKIESWQRDRRRRQLELGYEKACRRAQKKGRTLPPRDEYYNHWGYQYYMYSPFVYPLYFTPGLYYGWDPGFVSAGGGGWAGCAAGSCSAGVSAGACGGPGGCGAGGAGGVGGGGECLVLCAAASETTANMESKAAPAVRAEGVEEVAAAAAEEEDVAVEEDVAAEEEGVDISVRIHFYLLEEYICIACTLEAHEVWLARRLDGNRMRASQVTPGWSRHPLFFFSIIISPQGSRYRAEN